MHRLYFLLVFLSLHIITSCNSSLTSVSSENEAELKYVNVISEIEKCLNGVNVHLVKTTALCINVKIKTKRKYRGNYEMGAQWGRGWKYES